MIGLCDGLCQIRLVEDEFLSGVAVGEPHPVKRGDIVFFGFLHEVVAEANHRLAAVDIVRAVIHVAGAPFADDQRYVQTVDNLFLEVVECPVETALG